MDTAETIIDDNGGEWKEVLAGDNKDYLEVLSEYESPDQFLQEFQSARNQDWRDPIAGDDLKFKSQLERFKSPADFGNAFRESQQKIRSGQFREPLGPDATEQDIAAYRQQNGIPSDPNGYLDNLPENLVVGEDDKEIMGDFMSALHEVNAPPEVAHKAIEWYNQFAEQQQEQLAEMDSSHHQESEDYLRREWGGDYRQNVNLISAFIEKTFPAEVKDSLLNARDPSGRAIMNIPGVMESFAEMARANLHPMALPGQTNDPRQTVEDEISEIEDVMKNDRARYNKDEKMQERLRELYRIRIKHGST